MATVHFRIRQCERASCQFRFPIMGNGPVAVKCPRCGAPTRFAGAPFAPHEVKGHSIAAEIRQKAPPVEALLDNIRSTYNVGSLFRTTDGAGIRHLHLCGITATPDHPKVAKTALGAQQTVPWTYYPNGLLAARSLHEQSYRLWAMEGGPRSESLFDVIGDLPGAPIVLVVGNELAGVDPAVLEMCDRMLYLPMQGMKRSLNVAVAFGIVAYFLRLGTYLETLPGSAIDSPGRA